MNEDNNKEKSVDNDNSGNSIKSKKSNKTVSFMLSIIITVIITALFNTFIASFTMVSGNSMEPTFKNNDILIAEKLTKSFERFDVVIAKNENIFLIKRIIGLPGETIQIVNNDIYINGAKLDDILTVDMGYSGIASEAITLGEDEYFALGDNRSISIDSRDESIGPISKDEICGHVIFRLFPPKTF